MKSYSIAFSALFALSSMAPTVAAEKGKHFVVVNEDVGVPVFAYDLTDRPYTILGEVTAGVRKATVFNKETSQAKVYQILWKNAKKLGADAVVNAKYGDSHISAMSWGKTNASGTAVKFKPAEAKISEAATATPATDPVSLPR